jgi:hypothetical protein
MLSPVMRRHDIGGVADNDRAISWRGSAGKVAKQHMSGWVRRMVADLPVLLRGLLPNSTEQEQRQTKRMCQRWLNALIHLLYHGIFDPLGNAGKRQLPSVERPSAQRCDGRRR